MLIDGDRRKYIPTDSLLVRHPCGDLAILLFVWDKVNGRQMAGTSGFKQGDEVRGAIVRDFVHREPYNYENIPELSDMYCQSITDNAEKNYLANKDKVKVISWPERETVVLCGSGPSLQRDIPLIEKHRDRLTVLTMGKAQKHIEGDYYIGLDPYPVSLNNLKEANTRNTIAFLAVTVFPGVANLSWKDVGYYSHRVNDNHENVPVLVTGEHVAFDALQVAVNYLKAKKIILVGMEHWKDGIMGYYWLGKQMEAGSFWVSQHGIKVWNCTREGSVFNGVMHGKLSEALNVN